MTDTATIELRESIAGDLLREQEWTCPACGESLLQAGAVLTLAGRPGSRHAIPILVHQRCLDDWRMVVRLDDLVAVAPGKKDAAGKAAKALAGAIKHADELAGAAADDAARRARAAEEALQTLNEGIRMALMEMQGRSREFHKVFTMLTEAQAAARAKLAGAPPAP